jgi:serine/threonine protein kinase
VIGKSIAQHDPKSQAALVLGSGGPLKSEIWGELRGANKKLPEWKYGGPESDFEDPDNSLPKTFLDRVYQSAVEQFDTRVGSGRPPALRLNGIDYTPVKLLGKGGGGEVHLYENPKGERVALKLMRSSDSDSSEVGIARGEFKTHLALMGPEGEGHENVLSIQAVGLAPDGTPVGIFDLAPLGDVQQLLEGSVASAEKNGLISPHAAHLVRLLVLRDTIDGMIYMQEQLGARHGDLKPSNLFVGEDGKIKVADFGTSTFETNQDPSSENRSGTLPYQPPEIFIEGSKLTPKADTWAIGVIAHEMFKKKFPFDAERSFGIMKLIEDYGAKGDVTGARNVITKMAEDYDKNAPVLGVTSLDRVLNSTMHPDPDQRPALSSLRKGSLFNDLGEGQNSLEAAVRELTIALRKSPPDEALIKEKSDALGI